MKRLLLLSFLGFVMPVSAQEAEISAPETGIERQESTSDQEFEAATIIPEGGLTVSTTPITPVALLPERKPYQQALEELKLAQQLMAKNKYEAASDVALQAYDDLMGISVPRRNKKQRSQLRLERRRAATVYIDSSIAYIKGYVKKRGGDEAAYLEGRERLSDLRDVALNYPELMKKLNQTTAAFVVAPSTTSL